MLLENANKAIIDIRKLRDYCLSKSHPRGKHKANVFEKVINLEAKDANKLKVLLYKAVNNSDAKFLTKDNFGSRYQIDFQIENNNKIATIRSLWIVRNEDGIPRLITCYVL
ncbi:hypothetical protein BMS3Abin03_02476 [bacterium BMS3Abin03]|nr:hypothetical protein BMS3Abin03_02476 [bacterium BMS3Abin03]